MRRRIGLIVFVLALTASLGRVEPVVAQECDPTVCANPLETLLGRLFFLPFQAEKTTVCGTAGVITDAQGKPCRRAKHRHKKKRL